MSTKPTNKKRKITVTGILCPKCEEFIWSEHAHDMRRCSCKYCFVDGGPWYLRFGYGNVKEDSHETLEIPKIQDRQIIVKWPEYQVKQYKVIRSRMNKPRDEDD